MKVKNLIPLALLFVASSAFAGGVNEGPALCSYAQYTCQSKDKKIVACPFTDSLYVGVSDAGHKAYPAKLVVPDKDHSVGAGVLFEGPGVSLRIETGAAPFPTGWISYLSVEELGYNNKVVRCTKNTH